MQYRESRAAEARCLRAEAGEIRQRLGVDKNRFRYWPAGLSTSEGLRPLARDDFKAQARQPEDHAEEYRRHLSRLLAIRVRKATKLYWYSENLAKATMNRMSDASADWRTVT